MGLLFVLIGYFFDFKNDRSNFFKDVSIGAVYFLINFIFFAILYAFLGLGLLYCIFGFAIEIVLVFTINPLYALENLLQAEKPAK